MAAKSQSGATSLLKEGQGPFARLAGGRLMVMSGPDRGESAAVGQRTITVGSSARCDLVLTDKSVSRRHLQATWRDGALRLNDLASTNGSFYEESRFRELSIGFGCEFRVGRTRIKFVPEEEIIVPEPSSTPAFGSLVGQDPKMRRLFAMLADVAKTQATVIIEGETGTGKELVAEELHRHSDRAKGPFVVFDCGAVPNELIESALFGHVKGAFTGAVSDRKGAFAEADGGTIFLDEIGELGVQLQPTLLRVLDKRAVRRVGGNHYESIDVRVVAATNRDLRAEIANRNFREDLYYRLAVIRIGLPPLRERGDDIPYLTRHFVKGFSPEKTPLKIREEDVERLRGHDWPGNVRELRNVLERACVLPDSGYIDLDPNLGEAPLQPATTGSVRTDLAFRQARTLVMDSFERQYVEALLKEHKMNLSAAARKAEVDRKYLRELIRKHGLGDAG